MGWVTVQLLGPDGPITGQVCPSCGSVVLSVVGHQRLHMQLANVAAQADANEAARA